MKWKSKKPEFGAKRYFNSIAIIPVKLNRYWYWLCWMTFEESYLGYRWSRPSVFAEGKKADELQETLLKYQKNYSYLINKKKHEIQTCNRYNPKQD